MNEDHAPAAGGPRAGRPRAFNADRAVIDAAAVFWAHGYSGTSTRMLTSALGVSTSSLYAAYGSKAGLFDRAVRWHVDRYAAIYQGAVAQSAIADVVEQVLEDSVATFCPTDGQPGCLTSSAAMADTPEALDVRTFTANAQRADRDLLRDRFVDAISQGQIPPESDPEALTDLVQTLWHGLSSRANAGASRSELTASASFAHRQFMLALGGP